MPRFYDKISPYYDQMINREKAINSKKALLHKLVDKKQKRAADIGCGTGTDSSALALLGYSVVGFDPSEGMLAKGIEETKSNRLDIQFVKAKAKDISRMYHSGFDLVISLGNTLPNIPPKEIDDSLKNIFQLLKPNGQFIIQLINYEKILARKERIVNITENNEGRIFVRFYDFLDEQIVFNILSFDKTTMEKREIISTPLFPYTMEFLQRIIPKESISEIEFYGNLKKEKFIPEESDNLVIVGRVS